MDATKSQVVALSSDAPPPVARVFGKRLRDRRTALGLSQMKLAEMSGVHFTYISETERGLRNISLSNIVRLAEALGTDPGDLMHGLTSAADDSD